MMQIQPLTEKVTWCTEVTYW